MGTVGPSCTILTLSGRRCRPLRRPGADRVLAAERGDRWIAVEIRSFIGPSLISEHHMALGQFRNDGLA
ncbi:MAG: element excision factor XisH family protein [Isosphaeraceae bacterium]